jgi:hypothetical protein
VPIKLPRKAWQLVCIFGLAVAAIFVVVPVGTNFGDDPLLRLRQFDPELSPPDTTALCGSPLRAVRTTSDGTTLYELARDRACQDAAQRRLLVAVALGSAIVMLGLVGMTEIEPVPPKPTISALPSGQGNVGKRRSTIADQGWRQIARRPRKGQQVVR